ncbi:hypothetical protein [Corynebacterium diphtheriae]|uniref:hypothetical protein n=1 Tax=Corynebacterium diphtheriae TaxID=1717 RepID=UPI0030FB0239
MYETHPEIRAHVEELLNERGKQWIADSSNHCIFDSFLTMPIPESRMKNNASEMLRLMSLSLYFRERTMASFLCNKLAIWLLVGAVRR